MTSEEPPRILHQTDVEEVIQHVIEEDEAAETPLGGAAFLDVGTTTGTVAAGDDARFSKALEDLTDVEYTGSDPSAGSILVYSDTPTGHWLAGDAGYLDLEDLNTVNVSSPGDGAPLVYDADNQQWVDLTPYNHIADASAANVVTPANDIYTKADQTALADAVLSLTSVVNGILDALEAAGIVAPAS